MRKNKKKKKPQSLHTTIIKATILGFVICGLLVLATAGVMMVADVPVSTVDAVMVASTIASVMIAAGFATSAYRKNGMMVGAAVGGLFYVIYFIISLLFSLEFGVLAFTKLAICLLSGMIGGIYGVNVRKVGKGNAIVK